MKIKDAVVIDREVLSNVRNILESEGYDELVYLIDNSKPLEPIIKDAYNSGMNELNSNIHGLSNYLNDTEI